MSEPFAFDVFLSHSSKDKPVVRAVAERLRADGLRVWLDEWQLAPGANIPVEIEHGLESSRVLVLCMSANAFGSDWTQLEAGTFRFRDPLNKERRFIPLKLDETPPKGSLAQFLYVNWQQPAEPGERDEAYSKLLAACRPRVKPPAPEADVVRVQVAEKVTQLDYPDAQIHDYAFSPDGKRALSGGWDKTVRLWDLEVGCCLRVFEGHTTARGPYAEGVWSVAWSADQRCALSGSPDGTVRLWDVDTAHCLLALGGHISAVRSVALTDTGQRGLSGGFDRTVRLWDLATGRCLHSLEGHTASVFDVASSPDGCRALSGSSDSTVRLWDLQTGRCLRVLEGHTSSVYSVAWSADQHRALSGANDNTVRLWDVESGRCLRVLEGHTEGVWSLAWDANQRLALSCSSDKTVRLWDVEAGRCLRVLEGHTADVKSVAWSANGRRALSGDFGGGIRAWDLTEFVTAPRAPEAHAPVLPPAPDQVQYTNAKVLLVGDTNAGKTGLTERLAHDRAPHRGSSTSGVWATQWPLRGLPQEPGWEREVWLWDFGGQADQRLIHQLYLDHTALVLLMFDSDKETVLPGLREWQQALARSRAQGAPTLLLAGRTDVACRFDRDKVRGFALESGYKYFETSAQTGRGIPDVRAAILQGIPWNNLEKRTSPALFKRLKDEILKLRDEERTLVTFKELESILRLRLPPEIRFDEAELATVVSLLDGPGVLKELEFGTYILLRPEWINAYAQSVIRTLRAAEFGLGSLPVSSIAEGKLIFQTEQAEGKDVEKRLGGAEEQVVLQEMERTLLDQRLCLRQGGDLVFPSYCGLERPAGPIPPKFFVGYTIRGFLDGIYATLVVRLAHCGAFRLKELWRDAADLVTLAQGKTVGVKLRRGDDGRGELLAHCASGVTEQEQVIFASYIHEHLADTSTEKPLRLRYYACRCGQPVVDRDLTRKFLEEKGRLARIRCQACGNFVPLWDTLEQLFADEETKRRVKGLDRNESAHRGLRRHGQLLVYEVSARITSADQKCHEIPGHQDEGIDLVVEFTNEEGRGTGKHMYLQLKAGNSHLRTRERDGAEIFPIKKQSWVKQWTCQDGPMMLVIGTFVEESLGHGGASEKKAFAEVRWMEIGELLRRESDNGRKPITQIVFEGERLDAESVRRWRDHLADGKPRPVYAASKGREEMRRHDIYEG